MASTPGQADVPHRRDIVGAIGQPAASQAPNGTTRLSVQCGKRLSGLSNPLTAGL